MDRQPTEQELKILTRLKKEAEASLSHALLNYGPAMAKMAEVAIKLQPAQDQLKRLAESLETLTPALQMVPRLTADYQKILDLPFSKLASPLPTLPIVDFTPAEKLEVAEMAAFDFIARAKPVTEADIEVALVISGTGLQFKGPDQEIEINNCREGMIPHKLFRYLIYQHPNTLISKARFTHDTNSSLRRGFSETVRKAKVVGLLKKTFIPVCTEGNIQLTPYTKVDAETYQALLDQLVPASESVSTTS